MRAIAISVCLLSLADVAAAGELSGRIIDRESGSPVEGALVHVAGPGASQKVVATDRDGRYRVPLAAGTYRILIVYGRSRSNATVSLGADDRAVLDDEVDAALGEVIVVRQPRPAPRRVAVQPRVRNHSRITAPPYSDAAILSDAWTRAWLLLDVDEAGRVRRFKFLKRPGYDLEAIATAQALALRFTPARDARGRPIAAPVVWLIEWPSHGWLIDRLGIATRLPPPVGFPPRSMAAHVPCAGSGPLNLDSVHPTYRDCSRPDLSKAASQPWIGSDR